MSVLLLGDYFNGLADIEPILNQSYSLEVICFLDTTQYPDLSLPTQWSVIDFHDFHQLTIEIIEIDPRVIVYISPYLRKARCELYPDLADMANAEAIEHLREIVTMNNCHLIVISSNHLGGSDIRTQTLTEGEDAVRGMGKVTILRIPEIADHSAEGIVAYVNQHNTKNSLATLDYQVLAGELKSIINHHRYGIIELPGNNNIPELDALPKFSGNPADFEDSNN